MVSFSCRHHWRYWTSSIEMVLILFACPVVVPVWRYWLYLRYWRDWEVEDIELRLWRWFWFCPVFIPVWTRCTYWYDDEATREFVQWWDDKEVVGHLIMGTFGQKTWIILSAEDGHYHTFGEENLIYHPPKMSLSRENTLVLISLAMVLPKATSKVLVNKLFICKAQMCAWSFKTYLLDI